MQDITIVDLEPQLVIGLRARGKYELIAKMIPQLCRFAAENEVEITGPPLFICHELTLDESKEANEQGSADIEVAVPVSKKIPDAGEIKCYELPGGKMARIIHKGPYQEAEPAYIRLFEWFKENGKPMHFPAREVYLNDPNEVPPEEIITEIYKPFE